MKSVVCLPVAAALFAQSLFAQAGPAVSPRGVVNAFTQQPAPSIASPGSVIWINGLNLGPDTAVKAEGTPLPTSLGGTEVVINNRLAPLYSVENGRIVARIPQEVTAGTAEVVVRRGGLSSRPARIFVNNIRPSLRTANDRGFGEVAAARDGNRATLDGTGWPQGGQNPPTFRAYVGGLLAPVDVSPKAGNPGLFDISIEVPAQAQDGDLVTFIVNNQVANHAPLRALPSSTLQYLANPSGTPELRAVDTADLRGGFAVGSSARAQNGCYTSVVFDFGRRAAARAADCVTSIGGNAASPWMQSNDASAMGALAGPPESQQTIGKRVVLLDPAKDRAATVELPESAALLTSLAGGYLAAVANTNPAKAWRIDPASSEVTEIPPGQLGGGALLPGGGGGGGGGGLPGGGGAGGFGLQLDLGDGINKVISPIVQIPGVPGQAGQPAQPAQRAVVVADSDTAPAKAKLAFINAQNAVTSTRDFPDGWRPMAGLLQPLPANTQLPAGFTRNTVSLHYDAASRLIYVLGLKDAESGLVVFPAANEASRGAALPSGWFPARCSGPVQFSSLDLSGRLAIPVSRTLATEFSNPCPAEGFLSIRLNDQAMEVTPLPGAGQFSVTGGAQEMNDYMFGSNTDPSRRGTADTLYIYDGVSNIASRLDIPAGIGGFANLNPIASMGALIGLASTRVNGDEGLILFDLETVTARLLPVPAGFNTVQLVSVFPATRKAVARAVKADGTQFVVYDLMTGDASVVPNPDGVAFVAQPPAAAAGPGGGGGGGGQPGVPPGGGQPGGPGQPGAQAPIVAVRSNQKSNTVTVLTYDAERRQNGVAVLQVH